MEHTQYGWFGAASSWPWAARELPAPSGDCSPAEMFNLTVASTG